MYSVGTMTDGVQLITTCVEVVFDVPCDAPHEQLMRLAGRVVGVCRKAGDPGAVCEVIVGDVECPVLRLASTLPGRAAPAVLTVVYATVDRYWRAMR